MIGSEGVLRKVCRNYEQVENYEKAVADEELWDLHHRREIDENKSRQQLKDEGRYYDVEPEELIFLTHSDHASLHSKLHKLSEEAKEKISKANRGKKRSDEARNKMSEIAKKRVGENNGMFGRNHSEESRKKMSESRKGKFTKENNPMFGKRGENNAIFGTYWWNNGLINARSKEQPGPDFVRGRLKFNK